LQALQHVDFYIFDHCIFMRLSFFLLVAIFFCCETRAQQGSASSEELKLMEDRLLYNSPDSLIHWLEQESSRYAQSPDSVLQIAFIHLQIKSCIQLTDYSRANNLLDSVESSFGKILAGITLARQLSLRAMNSKHLEDHTSAMDSYLRCRSLYEQYGTADELATYYLELVQFYSKLERRDSLGVYINKLDVLTAKPNVEQATRAKYFLAAAEYQFTIRNEKDSAIALLMRCLEIAEDNDLISLQGDANNLFGFIATNLMDVSAQKYYERADSLYLLCGNTRSRVHTKQNYIRFLFTQHRFREAKLALDTCRALIGKKKWYYQQTTLYELFAYYFQAQKMADSCFWAMGLYRDWSLMFSETVNKEANTIAESKFNGAQKQNIIDNQKAEIERAAHIAEQDRRELRLILWIVGLLALSLVIIAVLYRLLILRNRQLKAGLELKELLLGEIHHRVKNNLQVISSLLEMQADKSPSPDAQRHLLEGKNRISSIAIVHELIYAQNNLAQMDVGDYVTTLINELNSNLWKEINCELNIRCDEIVLPVSETIPLGMLINELVTNSFKHARPKGNDPLVIDLTIFRQNKTIAFNYSDNGTFGIKGANSGSGLGMKIINSMTRQLHGEAVVNSENNYNFTLKFQAR